MPSWLVPTFVSTVVMSALIAAPTAASAAVSIHGEADTPGTDSAAAAETATSMRDVTVEVTTGSIRTTKVQWHRPAATPASEWRYEVTLTPLEADLAPIRITVSDTVTTLPAEFAYLLAPNRPYTAEVAVVTAAGAGTPTARSRQFRTITWDFDAYSLPPEEQQDLGGLGPIDIGGAAEAALRAPAQVSAAASRRSVSVRWQPTTATVRPEYRLQVRKQKSWTTVTTSAATKYRGKIKGLKSGASVRFRVKAQAGAHSSDWRTSQRVRVR